MELDVVNLRALYCRTSGTAVVPLKDVAMQFAIARCVQFQFRLFRG